MISRQHLAIPLPTSGFLRGLIGAFKLLNRKERVQAVFLVLSMNINALLGLVGLAGILPFVHLMLEPEPLAGQSTFAHALRSLGFTDIDYAIFAAGLVLIGLILAKNIFAFAHGYVQNRYCARAERRMATELLARVVHAPYLWLVSRNASIVRDTVIGHSIEWSRGVIRASLQLINELLFLVVALVFLVVASPFTGLLIGGSAALIAAAIARFAHPRINYYAERKRRAIRIAGVVATEAIAGGRDVRLSAAGGEFVAAFEKSIYDYTTGDADGRQWQLLPRLGVEVVGFSVLVGVALVALWSGMPRAEIASLLAIYAVVAIRAIPVVSQVASSVSAITSALPAVAEVQDLINDLPELPPPAEAGAQAIGAWRQFSFEHVAFTYPNGARPALGPLSLTIECGNSYGIVGKSGVGKSTLVDLLTGLLPPTEGRILLDGEVLDPGGLRGWIDNIACVSQTPFLLDGTLQENIEFGKVVGDDRAERLQQAVAAAGLTDMVRQLPDGLSTGLGDRGVRLSGGQRQRVAIARALYRGARLLILDEATSALDSLTEREVTQAIESLKGRMTLLVVAHRISTVRRLDELIVLDAGKIVGRGRHEKLLGTSDLYRSLVEAQSLSPVTEPVH